MTNVTPIQRNKNNHYNSVYYHIAPAVSITNRYFINDIGRNDWKHPYRAVLYKEKYYCKKKLIIIAPVEAKKNLHRVPFVLFVTLDEPVFY